jgi:hypothetical protein
VDKNVYMAKKLQQIILINMRKKHIVGLQQLRHDVIESISELHTPIERLIIDRGWH